MTMVRTLLYAPTPDVKERLVNRYGHHPAISFQATTDILDFFDRLHNADTVLLHHELPSRAASTLTRWLSAPRIGKPVIVVDVPPDPELIVRYYEVGASAYLLPGESAGKLHDVLGLLAGGSRESRTTSVPPCYGALRAYERSRESSRTGHT